MKQRREKNRVGKRAPAASSRRRRAEPATGSCFNGSVRDLAASGDGIVAHPQGRIFFVPGVWPGEQGRFRISEIKGRSGRAELVELEVPAGERVQAPCPHHGFGDTDCGGCPWQFMNYRAQLEAKTLRVQQALRSVIAEDQIAAIHGAPDTLGYRNRAQLKSDGKQLGYLARGSNSLVDVQDCIVLNDHNRRTLAAMRNTLPRPDWHPARGSRWTRLDIDDHMDTAGLCPGERRPFRQGNSRQNDFMRRWLADRLGTMQAPGQALELFAGSGNFTDVLVGAGVSGVTAADSFAPAVQELTARQLPGVATQCMDLGRASFPAELEGELAEAELLLLDPPREGFALLGDCVARAPKLRELFYISCDPASFARDVAELAEGGFTSREIQPLDLFPHTPHVEILAWFSREGPWRSALPPCPKAAP